MWEFILLLVIVVLNLAYGIIKSLDQYYNKRKL